MPSHSAYGYPHQAMRYISIYLIGEMCKGKVDFTIWRLNSGLSWAQLVNVDCPMRNNRHLMLDSYAGARDVHCQ